MLLICVLPICVFQVYMLRFGYINICKILNSKKSNNFA